MPTTKFNPFGTVIGSMKSLYKYRKMWLQGSIKSQIWMSTSNKDTRVWDRERK